MQKYALVTGASGGIGAQCARELAQDGYHVLIHYNQNKAQAEKLAQELGGTALQADITVPEQVDRMFQQIGALDLLVCNAGIAAQMLLTDMSIEDWHRIFAVNMDGTFYCCRRAIPKMVHNKHGKIITVSSMWGQVGASCEVAYSASKGAVIGFTKALAKELGPSNIQVNCVAPGVIDTSMNRFLTPDTFEALQEETPLGRLGTPADIAHLVCFLASSKADFITGQVFGVNGGFVI